jgi:aerobic carbon-monoxide dehydrogenase medium subunit
VRSLPVEELFADFLSVTLEPDELLTAIDVPVAPERSGSAYLKHSLRAVDPAVVGAAVWVQLDAGGTCTDARVGLGGVGLTPLRATRAEVALRGSQLDAEALRAAAEAAAADCDPLDDLEASAWYRRRLVSVYVQRAARAAIERAQVTVSA